MSVNIPALSLPKTNVKIPIDGVNITPKLTFQGFVENTKNKVSPHDIFSEVQQMQKSILNSNQLSPRDLILYQIKSGQLNLQVELISKTAEGALASLRKFQNNQ